MEDSKPRRLEEICKDLEEDDFSMELLGNHYCTLKPHSNIQCGYREIEPDHNNLYPCLKKEFQYILQ